MIANNSSGARSVAYGGTKDHVLALELVLSGGEVFSAGAVERGGAEWAAFAGTDSAAGRAFGEILPLLEQKREAILAAMPRVVKNCSGYRVETVLDDGRGPSAEAVRRRRRHPGPGHRGHPQPGAPARPAGHRHGLLPLGVRGRGGGLPGILALKPTSLEIMDSRFLAFVRKHNSRSSTPCCRRAPTPPCSSSSRRPTTPSSTRSSPPWTSLWRAAPASWRWCAPDRGRDRSNSGPCASRPCRCSRSCRAPAGRCRSSRTSPCTPRCWPAT